MSFAAYRPQKQKCDAVRESKKEKWRWVLSLLGIVVVCASSHRLQDVKPVVEENGGGEAVLRLSLAQPGSDPVSVRAKSSTLVSK
jgi:hypothetical protein